MSNLFICIFGGGICDVGSGSGVNRGYSFSFLSFYHHHQPGVYISWKALTNSLGKVKGWLENMEASSSFCYNFLKIRGGCLTPLFHLVLMIHSLKVQHLPLIYTRQVNFVMFSFKTAV